MMSIYADSIKHFFLPFSIHLILIHLLIHSSTFIYQAEVEKKRPIGELTRLKIQKTVMRRSIRHTSNRVL